VGSANGTAYFLGLRVSEAVHQPGSAIPAIRDADQWLDCRG
jgi:hypothetical protein